MSEAEALTLIAEHINNMVTIFGLFTAVFTVGVFFGAFRS